MTSDDAAIAGVATAATFLSRNYCLGCGSGVKSIASGRFHDEPLRGFIANDPWGENPLPYLKDATWEYVECVDCALRFHRRILSPEWDQRLFDRWMTAEAIAEYERIHTSAEDRCERACHYAAHALQLECVTRSIRDGNPLRVLDFGCGNGEFLQQCALFGFDTVGIDRSTARQEKNQTPVYAEIRHLDNRPFHAITLFEVLEHLQDPRAVLESLSPHLAPGGILVVETPDVTGVAGIRSRHEYLAISPLGHINGFTPSTLRSFVERLGYRFITAPVGYVTVDLFRVLKRTAKRVFPFAIPAKTQQYFRKPFSMTLSKS